MLLQQQYLQQEEQHGPITEPPEGVVDEVQKGCFGSLLTLVGFVLFLTGVVIFILKNS